MSTDPTPAPPPLDLAALRVIAEGATEGPWRIYTVTDSGGRSAAVETAWAHDEQGEDTELVTDWCSPEDAAHIVAFDPPTVLALIAELEHERKGLTQAIEWVAQEKARAEAAEAKIAAVRELHRRLVIAVHEGHGEEAMCPRCQTHWPCKTVAALDGTA